MDRQVSGSGRLFRIAFAVSGLLLFVVSYSHAQQTLLHYWNFNVDEPEDILDVTFTLGGAELVADTTGATEIEIGSGQDFIGENARSGDEAGNHLRFNNPIGSSLTFLVPTTGYENAIFMYETRRSGSGANTQYVSYTLDGENFIDLDSLTVTTVPTVITYDFSSIIEANDNINFALRIEFDDTNEPKNMAGNNRFDNVTLEGEPLEDTNSPPIVVMESDLLELIAGSGVYTLEYGDLFEDPDGDTLTITATSDNLDILAAVAVSANENVELTPFAAGGATISFSASDGHNPAVNASLRVLVYPQAHAVAEADYAFTFWSEDEPDGSYPPNMIFLQSDMTDPGLADELLFAYSLDADEYHDDDAENIGFPYRNTRRTRLNGLGNEGISFINTGQGRDLGAALVALNTEGTERVLIEWLAGTLIANSRTYNMRPQYRVGYTGAWKNITANALVVEYLRNETDGHTQAFLVELPADALGEAYVQVQWRYYFTGLRLSEESGARDMLRLDDISIYADDITTGVTESGIPASFSLEQNYPNPFNPSTTIRFSLPEAATVSLGVYNMLGQRVATLVAGERMEAGTHSVVWNGMDRHNRPAASGMYMYRIMAEGFTDSRRMLYIR